jgi:PPM family protein phosphatase
VREHNEDAVFADMDVGLIVLADGMGGYNAGEVAASWPSRP